jgi:hypothetical protein
LKKLGNHSDKFIFLTPTKVSHTLKPVVPNLWFVVRENNIGNGGKHQKKKGSSNKNTKTKL